MPSGETPRGSDQLLKWIRIFAIPIALTEIFFAFKVSQTGILLALALDVSFARLLVPLTLGLFHGGGINRHNCRGFHQVDNVFPDSPGVR